MRRQWTYPLGGILLSAGAPAGLLAVRLLRRSAPGSRVSYWDARRELKADPDADTYLAVSTAAVFSVFACVLGRQADRLEALSLTDSLTGLTNARGLFDHLESALAHARRSQEPLALLLVDLDGLKAINDRFGHDAGDAAIRSLAEAIRSELRAADVGARWGGDEFAILAPSTSEDAALAIAERIRALIASQPSGWPLSASTGVTTVTPGPGDDEVDAATLMRAADAGLYEAKRRGRDMVVAAPLQQAAADASRAR